MGGSEPAQAVGDVCRNSTSLEWLWSRRATRRSSLSSAPAHILQLLGNPFVAVIVGLLLATGLLFVSRSSFKRIQPDAAMEGMVIASISLFGRLVVMTAALWAYKHFAPSGFKPFALSLAGGFLVLYAVELVRYAGVLKRRPVSGARQ